MVVNEHNVPRLAFLARAAYQRPDHRHYRDVFELDARLFVNDIDVVLAPEL